MDYEEKNNQNNINDTENTTPMLSDEEIMLAYMQTQNQVIPQNDDTTQKAKKHKSDEVITSNKEMQTGGTEPQAPLSSNGISFDDSVSEEVKEKPAIVNESPLPSEDKTPMTTLQNGKVERVVNPNEATIQNAKPVDTTDLTDTDILFAGALNTEVQESKERRTHLISEFNSIADSFKNEYTVFYKILKDLPKVKLSEKFLKLYLSTNRAIYSNRSTINLANYQLSDLDPYVEFSVSVIDRFKELSKTLVSDDDFYTASEMHKMEFLSDKSIEILEVSAQIISNGAKIGRKTYTGYQDMRQYSAQEFSKVDNLLNKSDRKGFIIYGQNDTQEEETEKMKLVTRFGVEALDKAIGGLYEGDMLSLLAPAKGGKSRFATYIVHQAIISGKNICFWSVENGYQGWEALIRARHFEYYYNNNLTDPTKKIVINADQIRKDELTPELKELEKVSYDDLRFNKDYGTFLSIDEDFRFDTCLSITEQAIDAIDADLICIDYLQLIDADAGQSKNERITEVYKQYLQLCKRKKVAGIFPSQFKQSVVGEIGKKSNEELANMELRDSAGDSYEVIRTPDINLSLYGSVEDIKNGHMKILSIPSRNSKPFDPIDLYCDLGTCSFASVS